MALPTPSQTNDTTIPRSTLLWKAVDRSASAETYVPLDALGSTGNSIR